MLVNVICRDGNILWNIAPDRNGRLSPEIRERIREFGIREDINAIIGHIKASYQTNSFRQFYSPKNPIECYKIAFAFYELNDFDKALNYINVCLKLDSNYTNAIKLKKEIENIQNLENIDDLINNAKTSFNAGDYNEAIEYCDKILKIDQREEILNIKVESLYALNRPEDAMEVYKKFKK